MTVLPFPTRGQREEAFVAIRPLLEPTFRALRNAEGGLFVLELLLVQARQLITESDAIVINTHHKTQRTAVSILILEDRLVATIGAVQALTSQHLIIGLHFLRL